MYRISKVLNHNGVIAIDMNNSKEYVLLGKGVGFGKKPGERFEQPVDCTVYSLQETSSRGDAADLIKTIQPEYFQMANRILNEAERHFGKIDRSILFPMADHIAFAVQRLQKGEQISNPLTEDIKTLFHAEFKVASLIRPILKEEKQIDIDDDGNVSICGTEKENMEKAAKYIHTIVTDYEAGQLFEGKVVSIKEFGAFVEFAPGKEGMVHISKLSKNRVEKVEDVVSLGDVVKVVCL